MNYKKYDRDELIAQFDIALTGSRDFRVSLLNGHFDRPFRDWTVASGLQVSVGPISPWDQAQNCSLPNEPAQRSRWWIPVLLS